LSCLLAEIVELFVDGPITKSKNTQYDDISNGDKHQQAHRAAITGFGENPPINDYSKNDNYQTENSRG
jgi:hypothetical protein